MLARLPLPFAGTGEPVGLIRRSDAQPSPVGLALIDALRTVARQRMSASASASDSAAPKASGTGAGTHAGTRAATGTASVSTGDTRANHHAGGVTPKRRRKRA
jgi:LysR family pca operon transcriptional activator